jgi:signal transduction histidine kinase
MSLSDLIGFIAVISCLEVGVVFVIIYARITRRNAELLFSVLALCLGGMCWAGLMEAVSDNRVLALQYLRLQYVCGFAATTFFIHFVWQAVREPVHCSVVILTYLLGICCAVFASSDLFLRLPPGELPLRAADARGPLFALFAPLLILGATAAWITLLRGLRLSRDTAFAPLTSNLSFVAFGGGVVLLAAASIVGVLLLFPSLHLPVNPLPLAVTVFCLFIASALGREVLRGESEKKRLAELVRFREQAIRDIAHEIKNPLAGIEKAIAAAVLAIRRGLEAGGQVELLETGAEACKRLLRLLNNMLDTARMEAGRDVEVHLEETDLPQLVQSVISFHAQTTPERRIHLESELQNPRLRVDDDKVYQVVANLVHNAVKYSPDGGEVVVRLCEQNNEVRISVADHGLGMTAEQQSRLFQPFERAVDPTRKITGTGIGLHLVKRLVEAHGGRISVETEQGKGTTVTIALPK